MIRLIALSLIAVAAITPAGSASAQNLVVNGSFEIPKQADRGYTDYIVGSSAITGWDVVGVANTYVSIIDQHYDQNAGFSFPARDGTQWLDLAGYSNNAPNGVRQSIATVIGATYLLSFYVGNISGGPFGTQTSVGVEFSSGGTDFSCTNATPGMTMQWQLCSRQLIASNAVTTVTLRNLDPSSDFSNGVDDVSVVLVSPSSGVPEPATWAVLSAGFGLMGAALRRKRRAALATADDPTQALLSPVRFAGQASSR